MKSVIAVALAGFVAAVSAQSLSDLPSCALPCLLTGLGATNCGATDFACACSSPSFISDSKTCIDGACAAADQRTALTVAEALCKSAGVTITVPGSESTSPAASSTSVETSTSKATFATTAASTSTETSSPAASTTNAHTSSVAATFITTTSTEPFPSVSESSSKALNASATVVPSGNVTATSTSPPLQTTNAGNRLSGMSGFVALGLGIAAAFAI